MIPVFEPLIEQEEIAAVCNALKRGEISGSFGTSIPEFEKKFAAFCDVPYAVAVSSGTAALQVAVAALGIGPGDEVLVSASTNIATALAVAHNGALPIPIDSESDTWNLNLDLVEQAITSKTKAMIVVHLYGHPVDMDKCLAIARKHKLMVIEDCAEAHGATCRGKKVGGFGDIGCFSFYANKIITTGEGGMVTTQLADIAEKLKLLRNLAFTKPRFRHELCGYNFRMTGLQAAMGLAQLEKVDRIITEKQRVAHAYIKYLSDIPGVKLPQCMPWATHVYWMIGIVVNKDFGVSRDVLMAYLEEKGIESRTFFCPMNLQPCLWGLKDFKKSPCPVAENLWDNGLYLPSSIQLTDKMIEFISAEIKNSVASSHRVKSRLTTPSQVSIRKAA